MSLDYAYPHPKPRVRLNLSILPTKLDEGEPRNLTIRIPEKLLARVKKAAEKSGWNQTEVILFILRWGLNELDADEAKKR